MIKNSIQKIIFASILCTLCLIIYTGHAIASGGPTVRFGTIAAKGLVLGDNDKPIWAEYDERGQVVRQIGEASGDPLESAQVMGADSYRIYVATFEAIEAANRPNYEILYRETYDSRTFATPDGSIISKPSLKNNTRSVMVAKPAFDSVGLVLLQSPLDLNRLEDLPDSVRAVLLSEDGTVLETAAVNIGFMTAYYTPEGTSGPVASDGEGVDYLRGYSPGDKLWGPIAGAKMSAFGGHYPSASDENGQWVVYYFIPPCPGFSFQYSHHVSAELRYITFDPKMTRPGVYYEWLPAFDSCFGFHELPLGFSLTGLMTRLNLMSMANSQPMPIYRYDFDVDLAMLTGEAIFHNEARSGAGVAPGLAGTIGQGATTYGYAKPPYNPLARSNFDFDADGETDTAQLNTEGSVNIWLGEADPANDDPDLTRLADYDPDLRDQGLLQTISAADLEDTDIYVYRISNDQLVTSLQGLTPRGISNSSDSLINYRMLMRGPAFSSAFTYASFESFQARTNVNPELRGVQADHLRVGEQVKVIMVNRATGYIGTGIGTYGQDVEQAVISFTPGRIIMRPPNLKIRAERTYLIEHGLTAGDDKTHLIGSEGSALTSDEYIAVTTEWFDWDGTPLPADLPGYTGRLAKVVAANTLGQASNQLANFRINPGRQTHLVQLPQSGLDNAHFYIHVNGKPPERTPDFSATGAGSGLLQYRPKHYVPIQVPVFDEDATLDRKLSRNVALANDEEDPGPPPPAHHWVYRPEMQFSLFELEVKEINRFEDEETVLNIIDAATDSDPDTLAALAATDYQTQLVYSLLESEFPVLEPLGPDREVVFAVGEQELVASVGADQSIEFTNLGHLAQLTPEDFLSIRLYQNGDDENVLWEYAFGLMPILGPSDGFIFADDADVELYLALPGSLDQDNTGSVTIRWTVEGDAGATLAEYTQVTTDGVLLNRLSTSTTADDQFWVKAEVVDSQQEHILVGSYARVGPFTVVPAKPYTISLSASQSQVPADGISEVTLTAEVFDAYDNPVPDGTAVSMTVIGDTGDLIEGIELETTAGKADISIPVGIIVGTRTYEFSASDDAIATIDVDASAIGLSVSSSGSQLQAGSSETISFTATVANAKEGTPVHWSSTHGEIIGQSSISSGSATATLSAADVPGDGYVFVIVGGEKEIFEIQHIASPGSVIGRFSYSAIVGDSETDGTVTIEHWQGEGVYPFKTSTELELFGTPAEDMRLTLGTPLNPNATPTAYFPLQSISEGEVVDATETHRAFVMGEVAADDDAGALVFNGNGFLAVEDAADLQIVDNLFASIDFNSDDLDATDWPEIGPNLKQGPALVQQGSGADLSFRLGLVETDGAIRVEAVVGTNEGIFSVVHAKDIEVGKPYSVALRYKNGLLELEVDDRTPAPSTIERVTATGLILQTGDSIAVGQNYKGLLRSLRIGVESEDRLITRFPNGQGHQDITFDAGGRAFIDISSANQLSALSQIVGVTYASLKPIADADINPQPVRFARSEHSSWLAELFSVSEAHAEVWDDTSFVTQKQRGVAVVSKETSGWFSSLTDKLSEIADKAIDIGKGAAEIVSMVVGLDDFIVLANTLALLAAGANDEIDVVEVTFAAVGAILTISEIISAGSLSPAVQPLKWGFRSFKLAVKKIGPDGVKAAFGMAKGLGKVIKEVVSNRQVALELVGDTARALAHVAASTSKPIFGIFIKVIRAPLDFFNWIKAFKFFNKAGGCIAWAPAGPQREFLYYALYGTPDPPKLPQVSGGGGIFNLFVGTAVASSVCEIAFESAFGIVKRIADAAGDTKLTDDALREFCQLGAELQKYIVDEDNLKLLLDDDAIAGIAHMLKSGRKKQNVRHIARALARTGGLSDAVKVEKINRYFKLIGDLEIHHAGTEISGRLYGDMGKLLFNKGTNTYNTGFIKGLFHQLEFLEDLRDANKGVEALEKSITKAEGGVQRFVDVVADGGRKFELKNFTHYGTKNTDAVVKSLEKDLTTALEVANGDVTRLIEQLEKTHFVFRGTPQGAAEMIDQMRKKGTELLDKDGLEDAFDLFEEQMKKAADAVSNTTTQKIPGVGDLIVFQGKDVPY